MGEIKTNDLQEVKKPATENYHNIKPETGITVHEARDSWDSIINNKIDDNRGKCFEDSKEDKTKENLEVDNTQRNGKGENQEAKNELNKQGETSITKEEINLLNKLKSGILDGIVGDVFNTNGGSSRWMEIQDGNPVRYKQGPGGKYFDGKETVKFEGKKTTLEKWVTDDEKLVFLQKFGWLMEDKDVQSYSAKFKPENK